MSATLPRPPWLRRRVENEGRVQRLRNFLRARALSTVCESARCPNIWECFAQMHPTFMILGTECTRRCSFCSVSNGAALPVDEDEPQRIAGAIRELELDYAVLTSVTRDDLEDKGASAFARTTAAIRLNHPATKIEVLVPDFAGEKKFVEMAAKEPPDVFGHNLETVRRLCDRIRYHADYDRSLSVLETASGCGLLTKSAVLVGLGEGKGEVIETMHDLLNAGVRILCIGQYLKPGAKKLNVAEYVHPDIFAEYETIAKEMGFFAVASGPFVRSSYRAKELYETARGILENVRVGT